MTNCILVISDSDDNLPNIINLVFQSTYTIKTFHFTGHLDPDQIILSDSQIPDCVIVNGSGSSIYNSSLLQSLSIINKSIPVLITLSTTDIIHLLNLIDLQFSHFILSPINMYSLKQKIESIISFNSNRIDIKSSFISHPYYREFRHEILNSLTIAAGYLDLLYSNLMETNRKSYQDKISESLQKIQQLLSKEQ
jgi:response regulator RpfG family c-di-GMP phosphodiesterase